jgi:glycosyltransferase involved in cell wall biosynthesis
MSVETSPRITLVIPAYNEEVELPALLETVEAARQRYRLGRDAVEVIVADNLSTDSTADIARRGGARVVTVTKRSIAAARNAGAAAARGDIVAFVDADSRLHPDTFDVIERTLDERAVAGATGVRMSRNSLGIAASMLVAAAIARIGGIDTGVVFCRRADWAAVGGYGEERLFAEDVQFLFDLKRLGRTRGQRFRRARGAQTITSARKFDHHGDWHWFSTLARGAFWWLLDKEAWRRFILDYWYRRLPAAESGPAYPAMAAGCVVHSGAKAEYYFREGCHITEWWNDPQDSEVSIARARVEPGMTTRWHRLQGVLERYVVLSGRGRVEVGELAPETVVAGDVVVILPGVRQRIANIGDDDLVFLAVCTPRFVADAYEDLE